MYYPDYHSRIKKGVELGIVPADKKQYLIDYFVNNEVDIKRDDVLLVIKKKGSPQD